MSSVTTENKTDKHQVPATTTAAKNPTLLQLLFQQLSALLQEQVSMAMREDNVGRTGPVWTHH